MADQHAAQPADSTPTTDYRRGLRKLQDGMLLSTSLAAAFARQTFLLAVPDVQQKIGMLVRYFMSREPTVTPSRLATSSRSTAEDPLIARTSTICAIIRKSEDDAILADFTVLLASISLAASVSK